MMNHLQKINYEKGIMKNQWNWHYQEVVTKEQLPTNLTKQSYQKAITTKTNEMITIILNGHQKTIMTISNYHVWQIVLIIIKSPLVLSHFSI